MRVLPVDLRNASDTELVDMLTVRRASWGVADLPGPGCDRTMPGRRTACWLSYDGAHAVGVLSLVLPAGSDTGYVWLDVDPDRRREGAARQLLTEAVRMSWTLGRKVLRGRCTSDGPGDGFARAVGALPGGSETLALPAGGTAVAVDPDPDPDIDIDIDIVEMAGADAAALCAVWAPQAHPLPGVPLLHAVRRSDGRSAGLAVCDEDGTGLVVLAVDADPRLGPALAARLAGGRSTAGAVLPVWMPPSAADPRTVLATRTGWSLAVPEMAARLGML